MKNRRPVLLYYRTTDGNRHVFASEFRSVEQASRVAQALIIRRPEIESIEARLGNVVRWQTARKDWEGWL
jgi:hypothetical protein